jgi:hypothetical protein
MVDSTQKAERLNCLRENSTRLIPLIAKARRADR